MKNKYNVLILIILLFSCEINNEEMVFKESPDIANVIIKEYPLDPKKEVDFSKYVDSVKYVYLQTDDKVFLNEINELFFVDSLIVAVSKLSSTIAFFDNKGKYLRKIDKKGRGNGEYLSLSHVMVDYSNKIIIIYDSNSEKLLCYDYNGNYIRSIKDFCRGSRLADIAILSDGNFLCYKYDYWGDNFKYPTGLWIVDSNGNFIKYIYEEKESYPDYSYLGACFSIHNDGLIGLCDFNSSTTCHIIGDSILCRTRYKLPNKTRADYAGINKLLSKEELYCSIGDYKESDKYIFLLWITPQGDPFYSILTKSSNIIDIGVDPESDNIGVFGGMGCPNNKANVLTTSTSIELLKRFEEISTCSKYKIYVKGILDIAPIGTTYIISKTYVKH